MSDNIAVTPGSGATVAADEIGGILYQRVKPAIGADGTATDVSAGAGAVDAGTMRVILASDSPGGTATTPSGSFTSRSGSMTVGGTSKQLAAANSSRKKILIENPATAAGQNVAAAESLYIRFGASSAGVDDGTSIELLPGGVFTSDPDFVSTEAIQVNAATTNHRWIAVEG